MKLLVTVIVESHLVDVARGELAQLGIREIGVWEPELDLGPGFPGGAVVVGLRKVLTGASDKRTVMLGLAGNGFEPEVLARRLGNAGIDLSDGGGSRAFTVPIGWCSI